MLPPHLLSLLRVEVLQEWLPLEKMLEMQILGPTDSNSGVSPSSLCFNKPSRRLNIFGLLFSLLSTLPAFLLLSPGSSKGVCDLLPGDSALRSGGGPYHSLLLARRVGGDGNEVGIRNHLHLP